MLFLLLFFSCSEPIQIISNLKCDYPSWIFQIHCISCQMYDMETVFCQAIDITEIFTFSKQSFNESLDFCNRRS